MKQSTFSRRMPEGMRCSTVFLPPITSVWPALWPPWKRTTPCARSVSQSTILPLPSSPHCVPITTTLRALMSLFHHAREAAKVDGKTACRPRPPERLADLVVAAAACHGSRDALAIGVEHHARVIVVAAQLGEVEADRQRAGLRQRPQGFQRLAQRRQGRQLAPRALEHLGAAVQFRQALE